MPEPIRLGVNVDHVATVRQARGTDYPDPVEAAIVAVAAGAQNITMHLREDRRHIQERDVRSWLARGTAPLNLEMAATPAMLDLAEKLRPPHVCLVPERREEVTTEGGLNLLAAPEALAGACQRLQRAGIRVSLFVDADLNQLQAARATGAPDLEIHTGHYASAASDPDRARELHRIRQFAQAAAEAGFEVHAGHGLTTENVSPIARIAPVVELNIGHSLVARALFVGLAAAVQEMRQAMQEARGP
jgi:pyridoxine 5-phosphate synthase